MPPSQAWNMFEEIPHLNVGFWFDSKLRGAVATKKVNHVGRERLVVGDAVKCPEFEVLGSYISYSIFLFRYQHSWSGWYLRRTTG